MLTSLRRALDSCAYICIEAVVSAGVYWLWLHLHRDCRDGGRLIVVFTST